MEKTMQNIQIKDIDILKAKIALEYGILLIEELIKASNAVKTKEEFVEILKGFSAGLEDTTPEEFALEQVLANENDEI